MTDLGDQSGRDETGSAEAAMRDALLALLDFDVAAGVDLALDEAPHDRFAETTARRDEARPAAAERRPPPSAFVSSPSAAGRGASAPPPAVRAPVPPGALDPEEAAASARALAEAAPDPVALEAALAGFDGCALKAWAKSCLFYTGRPDARVVFMGYTPTPEEDRSGRLLEGREGVLLDNILAALGLSREEILFARAVPWRPAGARVPTKADLAACRPFAVRLLQLTRPEAIVCLGSPLAEMLLAPSEPVKKLQGRWQALPELGPEPRVLPTYDLERLLKMPSLKAYAWRDLRMLRAVLPAPR